MSRGVRSLLACGMLTALVLVPGSPATAASNVHAMKVFVGYADGIRYAPAEWNSRPIRKPMPAAPRPITKNVRPLLRQSPVRETAE